MTQLMFEGLSPVMNRKTQTYCDCCGQLIPPKVMFDRSPVSQRIYDFVARCPNVTIDRIFDYVYADDPNGGPESRNIISVLIHNMRPTLTRHGIKIVSTRGPGATYRLEPLDN